MMRPGCGLQVEGDNPHEGLRGQSGARSLRHIPAYSLLGPYAGAMMDEAWAITALPHHILSGSCFSCVQAIHQLNEGGKGEGTFRTLT